MNLAELQDFSKLLDQLTEQSKAKCGDHALAYEVGTLRELAREMYFHLAADKKVIISNILTKTVA